MTQPSSCVAKGAKERHLPPNAFPAPAGSIWEPSDPSHWRLARLTAPWRDRVRYMTALRSLEVGVSSWEFVTDSPSLHWAGRWSSRYDEMRQLEVLVDDEVVTSRRLSDAVDDEWLCLFDGLDAGRHIVRIHFPAVSSLELSAIALRPGAALVRLEQARRWCSWGDSITGGTLCASGRQSYVQLAAQSLGWAAINRGFGGGGYPDTSVALAIASCEPWDILSIAVGTNSAWLDYETPEEFGAQYRLCLELIRRRCPGKPIVCISPVVCTLDRTPTTGVPMADRLAAIREAIEDVACGRGDANIHYVNGLELLADGDALADGVHPGPEGHAEMAVQLVRRLAHWGDTAPITLCHLK
jgi:lysophospholipase L1-like esterase